ncbi:tetratricopeptide repeat protein [Kitasatospora sp. NPDC002227]|uniref:tetratricopeptide repeat protein n=1 Tax=Kitasatospora sp. NPDC002227 TaxID=3154773 RepID=UPI00332EB6F2
MTTPVTTVVAIYETAKTAYEAYQAICSFVSLGRDNPTDEDRILARLDTLHADFQSLQGRFDEVLAAVKAAVNVEQQAYVLNLQHDLDTVRAQARTAVEQLNQWVADGRTDPLLRADADNNSRLAANTLLEGDSYFYRPDPNSPTSVFDHRLAFIAYAYALTVRYGVISALNLQYRNNPLARAELAGHAARLDWIFNHADQAIQPDVTGIPASNGTFVVLYRCVDRISGTDTGVTRFDGEGGTEVIDNAVDRYTQQVRAEMRVATGLAELVGLHDTVAYWAKEAKTPSWSPWAPAGVPEPTGLVVAASDQPGHTTLVWRDRLKAQLRATSYDPAASPPGWRPSVAISPEQAVGDDNPATGGQRVLALSAKPGDVTALYRSSDLSGVYAISTDPGRPTGWPADPVKVTGDSTRVSSFVAAVDAGSLRVAWVDVPTSTLMVATRGRDGSWGPPQAATVAGACPDYPDLALVCPSPGVVMAFWTVEHQSIRSVTYDSRLPSPAWSEPVGIAVAPGSSYELVDIRAAATGDGTADVCWVGVLGSVWNIHYDGQGSWSAPAEISTRHLVVWGIPYSFTFGVTAQRELDAYWWGRDHQIEYVQRGPHESDWAGPVRLGQPWESYGGLTAVPTPENSVSLYHSGGSDPVVLLSCFFDTGQVAPAARIAEAQAMITHAGELWTLPGPVRGEAADRATEAVAVAREVVAEDASYRATLAGWLVEPTARFLSAVGRQDEAVAGLQEAVTLYDQLLQQHPDSDEAAYDKAFALVDLAQALWASDQAQGAQRAVDAVDQLRPVADRNPAYRATLARWLVEPTARFLSAVGRHAEAVATAREAVTRYDQLLRQTPESDEAVYNKAWAMTNLAQALWVRPDQAQGAQQAVAAVDLIRPIATRDPAYRPTLARWLVETGAVYLSTVGRHQEAVAEVQEAVTLYDQLLRQSPDSDDAAYDKAWALINLAQALWAGSDRPQGAQRAVDAVDLVRSITTHNPAYRPTLGDWLLWPTVPYLRDSGRRDQALTLADEAVALYTALDAEDPATYDPKLAAARSLQSDLQSGIQSG